MRVMSPNAVPSRRGSTINVVAGQITAGTSEKLIPIITVETHRLRWLMPKTKKVTGSSNVPTASISAR